MIGTSINQMFYRLVLASPHMGLPVGKLVVQTVTVGYGRAEHIPRLQAGQTSLPEG